MKELNGILLVCVVLWMFISGIVFTFRHPWMTDTERFLHFFDAMLFKKVEYYDVRPRT